MVDAVDEPLAALDRDGRLLAFNASYAELFRGRYGVELEAGASLFDLLDGDASTRDALRTLAARAAAGETCEAELRLGRNGRPKPYRARLRAIRDDGGRAIGSSHSLLPVDASREDAAALLQAVVNAAAEGVVTTDEAGRIEAVNPAAVEIFGFEASEMEGLHIATILPEAFPSEGSKSLFPPPPRGEDGEVETLGRRKDGSTFPVELRRGETSVGARRVHAAIVRDVSRRQRAERELSRREEWYRRLLQAGRDAIFVFPIDDSGMPGRLVEVNEEACRRLGYSRDELLTRTVLDINSQDPEEARSLLRKAVRDGHVRGETEHRTRDGRPIPVEVLANVVEIDGRPHLVSIARDVTERRKAEDALRESEARYRSIFDRAAVGMAEATPEGVFTRVNEAFASMLGRTPEDLLGSSVFDLTHPDELEATRRLVRRLVAGEVETERMERRFRRADGRHLWTNTSLSAVRDRDGRTARLAAVVEDVSERRRAEDRLRQALDRVNTVLASITEGYFVLDEKFRFVEVNEAAIDLIFSRSASELIGRGFWDVFPEGRTTEFYRQYHRAMREQRPVHFEGHSNIVDKWFEVHAYPRHGRLEVYFRDVTDRRKAEEATRRSEERLAVALEAGEMGVWEWDVATEKVSWSPTLERVHGLRPGSFPGTFEAFQRDMHPDDRDRVLENIRRTLRDGGPYHVQYRIVRPDGETRWIEARGRLFRDERGEPERMVGVCTDVTERRRTETAVRTSESRFRAAFEQAPFAIQTFARDGSIRTVNPAWADLWGVRREDVEGYNILEDVALEEAGILPTIRRAFEGEAVTIPATRYDPAGNDRPGRARWVEASLYPLKNEAGEVFEVVLVLDDVSDRVEAETAMRESEARLRQATSAGRVGVWEWDVRDDRVVWSDTHHEIHGVPPEEFDGTREAFERLVHPDDRAEVGEAIRATLEEDEPFETEFRAVRPNGEVRWVLANASVVRDEAGRPLRLVGASIDITERKRSHEALELLAKASEELAASLDYETTLANIARASVPGFADWCAIDLVDEDGRTRRLAVAHTDPAKVELAREVHERYPPEPDSPHGPIRIAATGEPELISDITDEMLVGGARDEEHLRILRDLRLRSYVGVPLKVRGRTIGAITFIGAESGRRYDESDRRVAMEIARRASQSIENATLYRELSESEARFRDLADNIAQLAWMADETGSIFWYNKRWFDFTGTTLDEMKGWGWREVHHPDFVEAVTTKFRRHVEAGKPWEDTFPLRGKDGEYRWFLSRAVPIRDEDGRIVRWFGTNTDVTRYREVARARARLAAIVESTDDAIIAKNLDGTITAWNKAAERIFGYTAQETVGRHITLLIPEERLAEEDTILSRLRRGERIEHFETVRVRKDGRRIDVALTVSPVRDESGRVIGASKIARDITDRKRAERAIRESEERFRVMANSAPVLVWVADVDGRCTWFNRPWLDFTGREMDQERGDGWIEGVHPDDRDRCDRVFRDALESREPFEMDYRLRRFDGSYRWILDRGVPRFESDGSFVGYIGGCVDIQDRKEFEEALRKSEALLAGQKRVLELLARGAELEEVLAALVGFVEDREDGLFGSILVAEEGEDRFGLAVAPSLPPDYAAAFANASFAPPHLGPCARATAAGEIVASRDLERDDRWPAATREFVSGLGLRSCHSRPIVGARGKVLGSLALLSREPGPVAHDDAALDAAADLAGVAIERKRAEEALRASERRFRAALSSDAVTVYEHDADLRYRWIHPNDRWNVDPIGRTDDDLLRNEDGRRLMAMKRRVLETGEPVRRVMRAQVGGHDRWFDLFVEPRRNDEGEIVGVGGAALDVTDRQRAEEARDARARQQAAVAQLGQRALADDDLQGLMDEAVRVVAETLDIEYAKVLELLAGGEEVFLKAGVGWREGLVGHATVDTGLDSQAGYTLRTDEPVIVADLREETRFDGPALLREHGVVSGMSCVIAGEDGEPWGVLGAHTTGRRDFSRDDVNFLLAVANILGSAIARRRAETDLLEHARLLETLNGVSTLLAGELDLEAVVQTVTDAGTQLTGAKFGAFFYNVHAEDGESYMLYALSGVPKEAFERFPMPRNTAVFGPTFRGERIVRSEDITKDPRYGHNAPHRGMPKGHPPVRSYLAEPVISRTGEVIGGLFFGHPETGVFTDRAERLLAGIAGQAAVAIDNARLFRRARDNEARFRQLADSMPQIVWTAGPDGRIDYLNRQWLEYTGVEVDTSRGEHVELIHEADRERVLRDWKACRRAGEAFQCEYRLWHAPSGRHRWHLGRARPVRDEGGRVERWYGSSTDIHEQKRTHRRLRRNAERLLAALTASDTGTFRWEIARDRVRCGRSMRRLLGRDGDAAPRRLDELLNAIDERDREVVAEELGRCARDGGTFECEFRIAPEAGAVRWLASKGRAYGEDGRVRYLTGACVDVTERKQAEEHQALIMAELNHRVKNTLATVTSMASQTLRRSESMEDFRRAFEGRLRALARAHGLLTRANWRGASLGRLIETVLEPFVAPSGQNFRTRGEDLFLSPKAAISLSLVIHELATNAVKYGALSVDGGEVAIDWERGVHRTTPCLRVRWRERGGPPVEPPTHAGFGSTMIRSVVEYDLGGDATLRHEESGFGCDLVLPWPRNEERTQDDDARGKSGTPER